ncbi:4'-phosphopantetheinyl transferase superfamily protein [Simiduia sp. 21SJ11W-1]|uniref:4'-phosphopantetheinyl transferase family protein n=1 Tax=Simiduia sp. 21SJ11W-1 TaxID=2909669 RepID=UPI0020A07019|nr:4'-phosphopantetheinyl transferase superfamily protein [Simiduia sp. 21SJ11W-1]UTA48711.1 4'-phosphopantetheinyl transferase superfamily protein [Simiduia sp. 21SJ11W-1]
MPADIQFFIAQQATLDNWPAPNTWLGEDEIARYVAMGSEARRTEFLRGHWLIRLAVGYLTGRAPVSFEIRQPEKSPPIFADVPGLITSLSHCKGWLALLVLQNEHTPTLKVGIDIETERDRPNLARLAEHSFGADWLNRHQDQLQPAFFERWTQCEAVVKASHLPLGTKLLRQQRFAATSECNEGLWLYHTRLQEQPPLHLSLATPYPVKPEGFQWVGHKFSAIGPTLAATRAPIGTHAPA